MPILAQIPALQQAQAAAGQGAAIQQAATLHLLLVLLYGGFLFYLLVKPEKIKKAVWFKVAVVLYALPLVLDVLWVIFRAIPATAQSFSVIAGGVATVALGLSIICLLMGQVGSISHLKEETQSDAKKPADKK